MSFALQLSSLSREDRRGVLKRFTCRGKKTQYNDEPELYDCYLADRESDELHLPLGVWNEYLDEFPNEGHKRMNKLVKFNATLLTPETDPSGRKRDQVGLVSDAMKRLKTIGTVMIAAYTGFGKSATGIYLSIKLRLKTLIICHLNSVRQQWPDEYYKYAGEGIRIQMIKGAKYKIDPDADVYIVGTTKASMMKPEDFMNIGTVIVDEAHMVTVTAFTKVLMMIKPRYLIGLSATPDRNDGLDVIFNHYFGSPKEFIHRKEVKAFTVYKVQTQFVPEVRYNFVKGRTVPDWNHVINTIETNEERWDLIAKLCIENPNEKILILCNRNTLANGLYELLRDTYKESVGLYIGNLSRRDATKRISVVGMKKGGTGLNDPDLSMLILASDTRDVRQYEGRIRMTNNKIYDIVDYYKPFENHYDERKEWYLQKGATIVECGVEHVFGKKTVNVRRFLKPNK